MAVTFPCQWQTSYGEKCGKQADNLIAKDMMHYGIQLCESHLTAWLAREDLTLNDVMHQKQETLL